MGSLNIDLDFRDLNRKVALLMTRSPDAVSRALQVISEEVMRLSQREVPHDTGFLQNSGSVKSVSKSEKIVGYHTPYAARLHEHPEFRFGKGRKGKYLEDPIKNNRQTFLGYFADEIKKGLAAFNG